MPKRYRVVGNAKMSGVEEVYSNGKSGGLIYDCIEDRQEAKAICDVLNEGRGPEWDRIRDDVMARVARAKAPAAPATRGKAKGRKR